MDTPIDILDTPIRPKMEVSNTNYFLITLIDYLFFVKVNVYNCPSQWPCGLRRESAAARLLGLWVRIPPGHGCLSIVSVVCCQVEVFASG